MAGGIRPSAYRPRYGWTPAGRGGWIAFWLLVALIAGFLGGHYMEKRLCKRVITQLLTERGIEI